MSKICCGNTYSDEETVCRVCGKPLVEQSVQAPEADDADATTVLVSDVVYAQAEKQKEEQMKFANQPQQPMGAPQPMGMPMGAPGQPQGAPQPMGQPMGAPGQPMGMPMGAPGQPMGQPMGMPMGAPGQPMGMPMGAPGQPMGMPMGAPGQMGMPPQPPVQKPPKPQKSEAAKEKTAKTCGLVTLIVAIVGFVAVAALTVIFMVFPSSKKYDGAKKKGFDSAITTEASLPSVGATDSDATVSDEEPAEAAKED